MKTKKITGLIIVLLLMHCLTYSASASPLEKLYGAEKQVPIIMYHNVLNRKSLLGKFVITPDELEQDLEYLKKNGYQTVVMSDLIAYVNEGRPLPEKPVVLTFDDGDYAIERYVFPLLEKYDMKAVVSIIGKVTDEYSLLEQTAIHFPNLTWEQINKLTAGNRIEIQNHTYDLHKKNGAKKAWKESEEAYKARLAADINALQKRILEMAGKEASTLTYPLGLISRSSDDIIKALGFQASLSCAEKINTLKIGAPECLFSLGRFNRPHGIPTDKFFRKLNDSNEKSFFD